jgi:hypothetical protein
MNLWLYQYVHVWGPDRRYLKLQVMMLQSITRHWEMSLWLPDQSSLLVNMYRLTEPPRWLVNCRSQIWWTWYSYTYTTCVSIAEVIMLSRTGGTNEMTSDSGKCQVKSDSIVWSWAGITCQAVRGEHFTMPVGHKKMVCESLADTHSLGCIDLIMNEWQRVGLWIAVGKRDSVRVARGVPVLV